MRACSRASCSDTRRARSPVRSRAGRADSSWRTGARCFSTRWATSRWRCSPSCYARSRSASSSGLGATRTQKVDVRVVAATNRDLERMVEDGSFRSDLFYRLNVFPIRIPPLKERVEDISALAKHFAEKECEAHWDARFHPFRIRADERAEGMGSGPATSGNCRTSSSGPSSFRPVQALKYRCRIFSRTARKAAVPKGRDLPRYRAGSDSRGVERVGRRHRRTVRRRGASRAQTNDPSVEDATAGDSPAVVLSVCGRRGARAHAGGVRVTTASGCS